MKDLHRLCFPCWKRFEELDDEERDRVAVRLAALIDPKRQTSLRARFTNVLSHLREMHSLKIVYEPEPAVIGVQPS